MSNKIKAFIAYICLFLLSVNAQGYFSDGNDLVSDMREWEKANSNTPNTNYTDAAGYSYYVSGIYDALDLNNTICAPNLNVTRGQVNSIVANFLKQNPARWSEPAYFLVRDALLLAFPCATN